jgi:hypothetical protein
VLVTLQRHAKARGYFSPDRFTGRTEATAAHELAMNPDTFTGRTDEEILSTLAHEMAHVWQQTHGKPPSRSYHDRQWAAKMKEIGLQPSTTGRTGQAVVRARMQPELPRPFRARAKPGGALSAILQTPRNAWMVSSVFFPSRETAISARTLWDISCKGGSLIVLGYFKKCVKNSTVLQIYGEIANDQKDKTPSPYGG